MSDDYLWDPTCDPEPAIRELEDTLAVLRFDGTWRPVARRRRRAWLGVAAGAVAVAAGVIVLLARPRDVATPLTREAFESELLRSGASVDNRGAIDPWSGRNLPPAMGQPVAVPDPPDAGLSSSDALAVVSSKRNVLRRRCWEPLVVGGVEPSSARLSLALTIRPDGSVSSATVQGDPTSDLSLGRCVAGEARRWRFPKSTATTRVNVPIVFATDQAVKPPPISTDLADPLADQGQLTSTAISKVVSQRSPALRQRCWAPVSGGGGGSAPSTARVTLTLVIGPSGSVQRANATDPPGFSGLGSCIAGQARGWTFPTSGRSTTVTIPVVFSRG